MSEFKCTAIQKEKVGKDTKDTIKVEDKASFQKKLLSRWTDRSNFRLLGNALLGNHKCYSDNMKKEL